MQAMILAAGFGTRLRPLSERRPKPLFPIFDTPILFLLIDQLLQAGCTKILVNCYYLAEQIEAALSRCPEVTVLREDMILGTGGGLRHALPWLDDEPLLVINSDIVQNFDLRSLYRAHAHNGSQVSLVTHRYQRFASLAVNPAGKVLGIGQGTKSPAGEKLAFTGVHVIEPSILERISPGISYGIIDLYRQLISEGSFPTSQLVKGCYWRDIGTAADYLAVHADIIASPSLFPALERHLHASGYLSPTAILDESVVIRDWAVVGAGAVIEDGAVLERCVVWDKAWVPAGSLVRDTVVV